MTVQKMIERIKWTMQNQSHNKEFCESCIQALEEVEQYRALGTVEELKEAREKQVAKKPYTESDGFADGAEVWDYFCPDCNFDFEEYQPEYCPKCGKKIDWSEEDE